LVWGQGMWYMAWSNWVPKTLTIKSSTTLQSSSRAPKSQQMRHNLRQNPIQPSRARSLSHMLHKIASMLIMCWLGTTRVRWLPSMWDPAQKEHWSKGMFGCPRFLWLTL
jgi:hypothetical protein